MSSFMNNAGGGTTQSMASALGQGMPSTGDPSTGSGLGGALTAGSGSTGDPNNAYAFKLPDGTISQIDANNSPDNANSPTSMAGLTGVGSGMTMPDFSNAVTGEGNYTSGGVNLGGLAAAGGKIADATKSTDQTVKSGGTGKVALKSQNFGSPVVALPMASGSQAGNSLLQMLQKYRAGTV
jgi:hypothetical protein